MCAKRERTISTKAGLISSAYSKGFKDGSLQKEVQNKYNLYFEELNDLDVTLHSEGDIFEEETSG